MLFQNRGPINARYKGNDMYDVNLIGVDEAYANGGQVDIHLGRFIAEQESRARASVTVIGADIEKGLFGSLDPIGKIILVDGHQFMVVGTMIRPAASFFGDTDNRVLLPYWTMRKLYPSAREHALVVTAKDGRLPQAMDEVRTILRIDRRVPFKNPDNFALSTAEQMVADFRQITEMTFLVMVALSSVGLLVGGIGVMNIMLVSVTERTHEIGLRKAIGARRTDIVIQFLLEAALVSLAGGIIGALLGWSGMQLVTRILRLPQILVWQPFVLSILLSLTVGIAFGIYPAWSASKVDPIKALRS